MPIGTREHAATRRWAFVAFGLIATVAGIAFLNSRLTSTRESSIHDKSEGGSETPSTFDPLLREKRFVPVYVPDALPNDDPRVSPDDQVVGITINGKHRAYALKAFVTIGRHVMNDLFGGLPVTVTHCPRTGCTRVFTNPNGRERLQVAVGGFYGKEGDETMLLRIGIDRYHQETGSAVRTGLPVPYPTTEYELTTWRTWRQQHPDSDVYAGPAAAP